MSDAWISRFQSVPLCDLDPELCVEIPAPGPLLLSLVLESRLWIPSFSFRCLDNPIPEFKYQTLAFWFMVPGFGFVV